MIKIVTLLTAVAWMCPEVARAAPGDDLRVLVSGPTKPGTRTLVLIHGNYDRLETWDRILPELERSFRIVRLDLPGFGASPNPRGA